MAFTKSLSVPGQVLPSYLSKPVVMICFESDSQNSVYGLTIEVNVLSYITFVDFLSSDEFTIGEARYFVE